MERDLDELAHAIIQRYESITSSRRVLVGIAGIPGSGKSTLGYPLADRINALLAQDSSPASTSAVDPTTGGLGVAICIGMDGWHHTREELDRFEDPVEARRRRGAAYTFDAPSYISFISSLLVSPSPPSIPFPTFSHALKDPLPSPFPIFPHHRIIIIEGLYALLDIEPWDQAVDSLDFRVWVECEPRIARERLIRRHLESGVESTEEAARERVDGSDMINGVYVREHRREPTVVVESVEVASLRS